MGDNQQNQMIQGACASDKQMFFECLKVNQGDQQSCSFLYENLQSCQRNENQMIQGACASDKQMFFECLKVNQGDQQSCSFLYENLQNCQKSDSQMSFQ